MVHICEPNSQEEEVYPLLTHLLPTLISISPFVHYFVTILSDLETVYWKQGTSQQSARCAFASKGVTESLERWDEKHHGLKVWSLQHS